MRIPMKGKVVMAGIVPVIPGFTVYIKIIIHHELPERAVVAFPVFRIVLHQIRYLQQLTAQIHIGEHSLDQEQKQQGYGCKRIHLLQS